MLKKHVLLKVDRYRKPKVATCDARRQPPAPPLQSTTRRVATTSGPPSPPLRPLTMYRSVPWRNPQNHTSIPDEHLARQKRARSNLPGIHTCKKASTPPALTYKWFVDPIERNKDSVLRVYKHGQHPLQCVVDVFVVLHVNKMLMFIVTLSVFGEMTWVEGIS